MKEIKYYESFNDDFVKSKNQDFKLKDSYKWIHKNPIYIIFSYIVYYLVLLAALIYCKLILKVKYYGKDKLKGYKEYYMYSNHTLVVGDILNPFLINFPRKPYLICSPSNLGIPFIGKLLSIAGALPIPDSITKLREFRKAVDQKKVIVIYPEAHQWPYCSFIRDFNNSSFHYPVENNKPVFTSTTVFKKNGNKKPKVEIYIDGPFKNSNDLSRKENIQKLHDDVYNSLVLNSNKTNIEYIKYIKK